MKKIYKNNSKTKSLIWVITCEKYNKLKIVFAACNSGTGDAAATDSVEEVAGEQHASGEHEQQTQEEACSVHFNRQVVGIRVTVWVACLGMWVWVGMDNVGYAVREHKHMDDCKP